jgi:glycosyltransferase involved in cell wall biosynthesis
MAGNRFRGDCLDRMRCRLLYVVGELHTGGSERQLYYLLRAMDRERYKPAVMVWNFRETDIHVASIRALGVPLYFFAETSRAAKLGQLRALIKQLQPEVVHSWSFYTNFAAYWAAKGTSAISLGSIRSDFLWAMQQCGSIVGKLSARWPRKQICNSAAAAESACRLKGYFSPGAVWVVQNAIDLNEFAPSCVPVGRPAHILGIGYLLPVKRWDLLLLAIEQLKERGLDFTAQIAGDGPLRARLQALAEDLGILDHVRLLGHVDNVAKLISEAALVVHTGDAEGCPNAVMEAMASGRAVVAMDAGDIPSLVENGKTGFVVPRGDIAALGDRLEKLLSDLKLCQMMGEAARKKAESTFGLNKLVRETFAVYRNIGWQDMEPVC